MRLRYLALALLLAAAAWADLNLRNGKKTVPTPGTPVALSSSVVETPWVTVTALSGNGGKVCFGGPTVSASTENAPCLNAGDSYGMPYVPGAPYNLASIYIDAINSNEGVTFAYPQ